MHKIKLCHISSVHPSNDTRIFHKECKHLARAGYDVTLIVQHDKDETIDGVKIVALPTVKNRFHRILGVTFKTFLLSLRQKAAIYHFHDPELIPIGIFLKLLGNRVIYDVHEDVPEDILGKEWIPGAIRYIVSKLFKVFENYTAKRFDFIITATPFISERFLRLGCRAMDANNYPDTDELLKQDFDWSQKERAVCYIGLICTVRGIFEMVKAISQTDVKLFLAGQFELDEQRSRAQTMSGWRNVKELGQVNRNEVAKTLSRSMAGLVLFHPIPNHTDAQPNKMFEYMSAGIPVIASDFPLWKEIIEGNQCGICVNPMDVTAIAEGIQWIISHPNEAKIMGENGRKAIMDKYNWKGEFKKLLGIYKTIYQ